MIMKPKKSGPLVRAGSVESSKVSRDEVEATESALAHKKLAKKLVNLILLPQDQKERGSRSMEDVLADFFPQLLGISTRCSVLSII